MDFPKQTGPRAMRAILTLCIFFLSLVFLLLPPPSYAGTLQSIYDSLDSSGPGTVAMHSISFTNQTTVPSSGKIIIKFPDLKSGDSNTQSSPSASTFQLNNLDAQPQLVKITDDEVDITPSVTVTATNPGVNTSPTITITLNSGTSIQANSQVKIFIGCETVSEAMCTLPSAIVLNPTKTNAQGTADRWTITVTTQDSSSTELDIGRTKIATIEPVRTAAQIDPLLTFTISGIKNSSNVNTGNSIGCKDTTDTNTGVDSTATSVNLGSLSTSRINVSAQLITVTTNVSSGYSLSATSTERLSSAASEISSSTSPSEINKGQTGFGVRPCGLDISASVWGEDPERLYAWPEADSPLILSSDSSGPVGNTVTKGNGMISVEYAATVSDDIPAGSYKTSVTYILTATF